MRRPLFVCCLLALSSCECAGPPGDAPPPPPPVNADPLTTALTTEVRRLTQTEINRTLRDTLQEPSAAASRLLSSDTFTPYDNNYVEQQSSATLVDGLDALATDVAARVLADPLSRAAVIPCVPAAVDDEACFRQVVQTVGKRMLRRPLDAAEVDTYLPLLAFAREESAFYETGFDTAVEVVLRAFLLDPEFLFRIEVGTPTGEPGVARLNPYETATRMSYLLWGSGPDDAVLAAADDGSLADPAARAALAASMLQDPRAREQLERFHAMWLGYRAIPVPTDLSARFGTETNALIDRVIFDEQRDYLDVFTLEETFLDDELADHYGLPRPETSPGWVSTAGTERGGLLSQGAVLASFSKFTDTSPTQRGILVRNRLLCIPIEPPPPEVNADEPPPETADAVCKIDRYRAHTQSTSCNACHSQMDPIGFGLENYDIQGRFREHDDDNADCLIDGIGELPGFGVFHGPKELGRRLVDEDLLGPCFVEQMTSFAAGRPLTDLELGVADAWHDRFVAADRRLDALLLEQIAGDQFVTRREAEVQP
ncbi:MAG: DUF1588 domain-containing protein [Deltaproteobacteria bacterium]|nr:DUF1588 domain-containing protein [Deltaproteobacteria bacterium]